MEHPILDTAPKENLRKPIPWWRAGLLGGVAATLIFYLFVFIGKYAFGLGDYIGLPSAVSLLIGIAIIILPIFVCAATVATFGSHHLHFLKIFLSACLAFSVFVCCSMAYYIMMQGLVALEAINWLLPSYYVVILLVSFLLWFTLGHWKKYRNQVMRD